MCDIQFSQGWKVRVYLQRSASIQPRTSHPKIGNIFCCENAFSERNMHFAVRQFILHSENARTLRQPGRDPQSSERSPDMFVGTISAPPRWVAECFRDERCVTLCIDSIARLATQRPCDAMEIGRKFQSSNVLIRTAVCPLRLVDVYALRKMAGRPHLDA